MRTSHAIRSLLVAATVLLTALAGSLFGPAGAGAAPPGVASLGVSGDVGLGGGLSFFHVETSAQQTGTGTAAIGAFAGNGEFAFDRVSVPLPITLAGPVTCLSVHGDTAAFLYPVVTATPPALSNLVAGQTSVLFTVTHGTAGAPDKVGFLGPLPSGFFHGCEPTGTPFVFSGKMSITPAT